MRGRIRTLAVVAAGIGVIVAGALLSPDGDASARSAWVAEPPSGEPRYSGPDPAREDVLGDFDFATAAAGAGPAQARGSALHASECVAARAHDGPADDEQLITMVSRLTDRGWRVTRRRTAPTAVAMAKGTWDVTIIPEGPTDPPFLSLLALRITPACEKLLDSR
ncbi:MULTISPECIES: hypothetical protein [Streptomyces]|uniref:hypothetical protein n=1 Tax=Streptomyces TaxID=1883 RepID=UPI00207AC82E|nr:MULTISPECIES: hypothetical protein [Streptomyces]MCM9080334.1 hypothetical protein [Streptomyces spororaveus]MCX5305251.1 hypothetical protein [Streptomyces sp. NBC_00160]